MTNARLSMLVLKTHQVAAVVAFYETIGLSFTEEQHGSGPLHFAGQANDVLIEIYPLPEDKPVDTTTRLGFAVDNIAEVLNALLQRELSPPKTAKQTEWGLRAVVKDPDGRAVELYQK